MKAAFYKLTLVTHKHDKSESEYLKFIKTCAEAGITAVQLREKNTSYQSRLKFGKEIQKILAPFNLPLIINDDLNLAADLNADGIHLGQTDSDPRIARNILGPDKIIGVSINSIENLYAANLLSIDYVGIGAIFPTQNKIDVSTIWNIDGLKKLSTISRYPIIAIGGINETNAREVMLAGSHGIAAIGAFHDSNDLTLTVRKLKNIINLFGNKNND